MTQNEKDLLLKDLCARLPYDVKFPIIWPYPIKSEPIETIGTIFAINRYGIISFVWTYEKEEILQKNAINILDIKPYLFPLSSMTDEQNEAYLNTCKYGNILFQTLETFEWCLKNHFDYRNLIQMGLAIDATGKNIY